MISVHNLTPSSTFRYHDAVNKRQSIFAILAILFLVTAIVFALVGIWNYTPNSLFAAHCCATAVLFGLIGIFLGLGTLPT